MTYLLVKSLHVCAMIVWISGMVLQVLSLRLRGTPPEPATETGLQALRFLRCWDRLGTAPAMLVTWVTGLFLATQGGWFGNRWLFVKLAIVILLSAMHGILAGRLRAQLESQEMRIEPQTVRSSPSLKLLLPALFVMTAGIVVLVIVKPF